MTMKFELHPDAFVFKTVVPGTCVSCGIKIEKSKKRGRPRVHCHNPECEKYYQARRKLGY